MASKICIKCHNCEVIYSLYQSSRVRIAEVYNDGSMTTKYAYLCPACLKRAGYKKRSKH